MRQAGFTSLAAVGMVLVLAVMGAGVVALVSTSQRAELQQVDYEQATFVAQAGLEYAMKRLYEGRSPVTGNVSFGPGAFRISQQGNLLTVQGRVRESGVARSVTQPTQADCLKVDTSESHTHHRGSELRRIYLTKDCLESIVLDKMILRWEPDLGESYDQVRVDSLPNTQLYDAPPRVRSGDLAELLDSPMRRNQRYRMREVRFPSDMRGKSYHLTFFLGDGSRKEVPFTLGPCPHSSC